MTTSILYAVAAFLGILVGIGLHSIIHKNVDHKKENSNPCDTCKHYSWDDCLCDERKSYDQLLAYNKVKGILSLSLMTYLDLNKPQGKMCLSNGECADIDRAFDWQDWDKIFRYIQKYNEKYGNKL
jgi:hypothetical protein